MKIYTNRQTLTLEQQKKLIDRLISGLIFESEKLTEGYIMREFNISQKTYKFVINVLIGNFVAMQKRTLQRLRDQIPDRQLAQHCYENKTMPALYEDNKDIFKKFMKDLKEMLVAKL